ncbi:cupin domain-containing protein [Amycolatopsis sp. H20-H5]|uniref:cupin domain-containing protein n=1 Tax=Amycolatopsis sp. H20-H5 TaxID=3046309 RepID=UPI002DBEF95C|nr:cupin domain-containing protein [Amycolatopsis sp. H20-H5]MEC3974442.1 cupin domain-containing protein [Amycolatopsis sp. H20-H5]
MAQLRRYVVGLDENGHSAVLRTGLPNQQEQPGFFWRGTLWKTRETPVDNDIDGDRSLDGGAARSPFPGGMLVRALELWPDPEPGTHQKMFADVNILVGQRHEPTDADRRRGPTMHRTDTLDVIHVVRGEIHLVLDDEDVHLKASDTVIIQGTNHGWSNRSDAPCLMLGTMIDALPREAR